MAMRILDITLDDGRRCANLLAFLSKGKWELNASDAEELGRVKKWVHDLAVAMATELKTGPQAAAASAPPTDTGFQILSPPRVRSGASVAGKSARKKK